MKKTIFTTIFLAISLFTFAQNNYYWSVGKKHYLKEKPSVFIVNFADKEKLQDVQKELQSEQDIEYAISIKDNLGLIITREGVALTTDRLKAYDEIENAMPAYECWEHSFLSYRRNSFKTQIGDINS